MRSLLPRRRCLLSPLPAVGLGRGRADDHVAGPADRRRAHDRGGGLRLSAFDLVGFHWQGSGRRALPDAHAVAGRWSALAAGGPGGRGSLPDPGSPESALARGLAARQPVLGRPVRPRSRTGSSATCAALRAWYVWSPVAHAPVWHGLDGRLAADRARARSWRANEEITPRAAALRAARLRSRSSTTRPASNAYTAAPVGRDRPRDRAVPRARERLERHRLQLPRRQATARSSRAAAGGIDRNVIGAHAEGFNTGSVGVAADRQLQHRASVTCRAARRSSRCSPGGSTSRTSIRSARSTWTSGGNPEVPGRQAGRAAGDLRPPRYRASRSVPGHEALLAAALDLAADGGGDRAAASSTRPVVRGRSAGRSPFAAQALRSQAAGP